MFPERIEETVLTSRVANSFFKDRIEALCTFNEDVSFVSTLRALAYPRMEDKDKLFIEFSTSRYGEGEVKRHNSDTIINAMGVNRELKNKIHIVSLTASKENNKAIFDMLESKFCVSSDESSEIKGWGRLERFTDFYKKSFYADCFINPELKSVAIFVEDMNMRKMHYLQCSIFAFLPWYFNPEDGVSKEEMDLINSLREKKKDKYIECLEFFAEKYDFRDAYIKKSLFDFETKFEKTRIEGIKNQIIELEYSISDYQRRIDNLMKEKRELDTNLFGFEIKVEGQESSEVMDYFLCNKKLSLECVNDDEITFITEDILSYFDEDMAKTVIDNRRSYVYRMQSGSISSDDMKALMVAIFIDQEIKVNVCSAYRFAIGTNVRGISRYTYPSNISSRALRNPHIDRYSCLGNYEREINSRIRSNDYIGAIELCMASCKSLNFGDSTVMESFMRDMYSNNSDRFLILPNGDRVTVPDAINWLKQEEK